MCFLISSSETLYSFAKLYNVSFLPVLCVLKPCNSLVIVTLGSSDFELAKLLCQCQSLPPFLIKALLDQGYTENDLLLAGITLPAIQGSQAILDGDGNEYTSITIGNQTWLRENLKTTSHIDGVPIVHSTSYSIWIGANSSETPSYSYVNNSNSYTDQFGLLYNWYTVENNDVCPLGFRVPEIADWVTLDNYFGSSDDVYLKEMGFDYWVQPNQFSTNFSGFSARGPGHRDDLWNYYEFKARQSWWSTTESSGDTTKARFAQIWPGGGDLSTTSFGDLKAFGYSIRCIKN